MRIVFALSRNSEMDITEASKKALAELPPVVAADYMQDVLCDALRTYNDARERCGWERLQSFSCGEP